MDNILKKSIGYQLFSSIKQIIVTYTNRSRILTGLGNPPSYASPSSIENSFVIKILCRIIRILMIPVAAIGNFLRHSSSGSRLLHFKVPPVMSESLLLQSAVQIRVESALFLVALYPLIDFVLRKVSFLQFLSSGWDELLLILIILAWPLQMALRGKITYRYTPVDLPILIYTGITLFLFFMRSGNVSLGLEGARVYIEYLLWFFAGSNLLLNRRQFNALMKTLIGVAIFVAAVGIYQQIIGVETPASWVDQAEAGIKTRVYSIVVSPNILGSLMILFTMITGGQLLVSRNRWERWGCLAALAAMAACMVFTYSRGAWLALGLAILVFSLMYNPRLLMLIFAAFLAGAKLVPGVGSRLSYMLSPAYMASSQKGGRLGLWQAAYNKFWREPVFGSGFGTFGGAVAARRVPGSVYVDNFYLKTMVESGIVGLMALLFLLASTLQSGYTAYKKIRCQELKIMAAAILSGLIGIVAHNAVENIFEVPMMATYFWLLAGLLVALPYIDMQEKP